MKNLILIGGQWGDEGKAKIVDLLAQNTDLIIRFQGGANAGHTVVAKKQNFKFHLIPSGILNQEAICIIGAGTVIEPSLLIKEINNLKKQGLNLENLKISPLANLTMPWHLQIDSRFNSVGSTKRGIGQTYADKYARVGFQIKDLIEPELFKLKLEKFLPQQNKLLSEVYGLQTYSSEEILEQYLAYAEELRVYFANTNKIINSSLRSGKKILFEGAQGSLLDTSYGTYPFVTSSHPIAGGACIGGGIGPSKIDFSLGVFKSFLTRVGLGVFPTEIHPDNFAFSKLLQKDKTWAEVGTTTGRQRRVGWFDLVLARYVSQINSLDGIALTKIDVLDQFEDIFICDSYRNKTTGEVFKTLDSLSSFYLEKFEPVYIKFSGWQRSTFGLNKLEFLPKQARKYLDFIAEELQSELKLISTGPKREDTIDLLNY